MQISLTLHWRTEITVGEPACDDCLFDPGEKTLIERNPPGVFELS